MNPFPPEPIPYADVSASWMRRFMSACRMCLPIAGPGLRASYTPNGTVLTLIGAAAASPHGLRPFAVRWHQPENAAGQWEIYLPAGCVSLGATCGILNSPASGTAGHGGEDGWYLLPFGGSPADGDAYRVVVHCKRRAVAAGDLPSSGDPAVSPMILAWMHDADEEVGQNIAYAGDEQSFLAAEVRYSSAGSGVAPAVMQAAKDAVHYTGTQNAEFDLWWAFAISGTTLSVPKMGLLRRTLSTGTDVATIDSPVACEGASRGIYLRVALTNGVVGLTVALDVNATAAGADFFIVQLYAVDQYHVASDYRSALWRLPMYLGGR